MGNRNAILLKAISHVIKSIILIGGKYLSNYIAQEEKKLEKKVRKSE